MTLVDLDGCGGRTDGDDELVFDVLVSLQGAQHIDCGGFFDAGGCGQLAGGGEGCVCVITIAEFPVDLGTSNSLTGLGISEGQGGGLAGNQVDFLGNVGNVEGNGAGLLVGSVDAQEEVAVTNMNRLALCAACIGSLNIAPD